ncbi:hypothetical protein V6N13_124405 [Hibiscus sabdariffa]
MVAGGLRGCVGIGREHKGSGDGGCWLHDDRWTKVVLNYEMNMGCKRCIREGFSFCRPVHSMLLSTSEPAIVCGPALELRVLIDFIRPIGYSAFSVPYVNILIPTFF